MKNLTLELLQIMEVPEELKPNPIIPENLHQGPTREELRYLDKQLAVELDDEEELDELSEETQTFFREDAEYTELNFDS